MIIDSHCHLSDERLRPRQEEIISSLRENGLESVFEVGWDLQSSKDAVALSKKYSEVYAIVGTHPHDAKNFDEESKAFYREVASDKKVLAIGEIGLDYYYDLSPREEQKRVFEEQIVLADEAGLPVVLHIRDAYKDALDILNANKDRLNHGILMHCYSSSAEMLREFNKLDCYYALGGAITFKNAKKDDVIKAIPEDRLLVETDSPYMTPVPYRGRPNVPYYVNLVVDKIAEVKNVDRSAIERSTYQNTFRLFTKYKR